MSRLHLALHPGIHTLDPLAITGDESRVVVTEFVTDTKRARAFDLETGEQVGRAAVLHL